MKFNNFEALEPIEIKFGVTTSIDMSHSTPKFLSDSLEKLSF